MQNEKAEKWTGGPRGGGQVYTDCEPGTENGNSGWALFASRNPAMADVTADGYYVQAAKFLAPKWQATVKLEEFDPNNALTNSRDVRWLTVGLNYYICENRLKVMANYVFRWERVYPKPNDAILIQFQRFFL